MRKQEEIVKNLKNTIASQIQNELARMSQSKSRRYLTFIYIMLCFRSVCDVYIFLLCISKSV